MPTSASTKHLTSIELGRIRRAVGIARLMDTAVRLPVVGVRIGADSILGLIPAVGDVATSLIGLYILNEARRLGIPNDKLARMAVNLGIDAAGGTVPLLGDLFDVYFKSHRRNVGIILDHFGISEDELNRRI
ncbi:DUF4112 domain-containing protein [Rhizobium leguminosarum bv. viciae]|jgi:hypothetical protein|uniref:DUF4112 domain-containing protein n=1 Tax=Rhizobium leguminosarum bv. viciae TaxID=387 RepID=A0A8I2KGI2_RHILV|nr:DUF4112 domain-containing protein [Rhizobium leguminosarum]MBY5753987.1 DUF4112 domain-containing protein [Rhizobium leguminosarum]MBY5792080.1 DUF4112 domain-containing protein [Rhizobium leguminosarum]MBY5795864.1 DUF4112 domain-containing protein [Rhizobium leguminosarum]MBY5823032.1 DUF4112 domain-containing protein [Rhizobium leguminosarum]NKM43800.1 DUF4112 domain-containing protein [Rhizobium leguminosarum bv. viciae]